MHSRVARSNIYLLNMLGAEVRVIGPSTLMPSNVEKAWSKIFYQHGRGFNKCRYNYDAKDANRKNGWVIRSIY